MRLLYLVPEFPSQTHAFFWREVQGLRAQGLEVTMVSTRRPPPDACRHEFAKAAAAQTTYLFPPQWVPDMLHLLMRPGALVKAARYIMGLRDSTWAQRLSAAPLIIPAARLARLSRRLSAGHLHVHSFANAAHVAALAKLLGGCNYSITLHGDLEVYGRDHASKTRHASFVTCVTVPLKKQLVDGLGLPASFVHLLSMGVDSSHFVPRDLPPKAPSEPLKLLTVARLHANKGHRFALQALRSRRDSGLNATYTIVGDGPAREEIEQEVLALGLSDCVRLVGTKSESEILELLQSSDALLLTSFGLGEAAPVAVMEAMSCGLPVVCSVIGGTRDMIDHGQDGFLVEQKDVGAIAECIRLLSESPSLRVQLGEAARARAIQHFDSFTLAGKFSRLFTEHRRMAD
ncbi:glycosyltransferase [Hydrogenophaga sp.]|uniref:glycosyltransferase n=1 Tax=Hydrogenophaga sp. TaxID=1904254 RepID=UPI003F72FFF3